MTTTADDVWRLLAELVEAQKETEKILSEQNRRIQEIENEIKKVSNEKRDNPLVEFTEWKPLPVILHLFKKRGINIYQSSLGIVQQRLEGGLEIDFFLVSDTEAILIKQEIELTHDDVDEHIERLAKFKQFMPRFADVRALGAVGSMVVPKEVARYAYRCGFFVLAQSGENIVILNDDKFQPKVW